MKKPSRRGVIQVRVPPTVLPRALRMGVLTVDRDDEIVVCAAKRDDGHWLNRSAATVWRALDGEASIDCPPGTVCFTLGCRGPSTFGVPIAPTGTNCSNKPPGGAGPWQHVSA